MDTLKEQLRVISANEVWPPIEDKISAIKYQGNKINKMTRVMHDRAGVWVAEPRLGAG
jgi:hypothetical protein